MTEHRTQLYLDEAQYRWLKRRSEDAGSIAAVVRELIDTARGASGTAEDDPFLRYLLIEAPGRGPSDTTVETLDEDLYSQ
ncbi:MAG: hypothetical protein WD646_11190 [Actinomycetota bacterium]